METQRPGGLCSVCHELMHYNEPGEEPDYVKWPAQTFEVFTAAVEDNCAVCSIVWNLSAPYRHVWSETPKLWEPVEFMRLTNETQKSLIKFDVVWNNPVKKRSASTSLRLLSPDEAQFKNRLDIPVLERRFLAETAMAAGKRWLTICRTYHAYCDEPHPSSGNRWHPTRLLDVGSEGSTSWKLCVVAEDGISPPLANYLTLSYRWGPNPRARLLSSNIASLRLGSPVADLPVLFRDVVALAQHFSIRYIWIDALCIMQDSQEDWEAEASTMHRVYANSSCNISASASGSPEESLYHAGDRDFSMIQPGFVELTLFSTKPEPYYVVDASYWDRQIFDGPLHNRGWVFQERYLSPRVLYFAKNQLLWECLTDHQCEVFRCGIPYHQSDKSRDALYAYFLGENISDTEKMSLKGFRLWTSLIKKYSRCELTNPSDKLFAMAGIAKLFQNITRDEYVAGLWKSRLLPMMEWWVQDPRPRQSLEYRAPSWSWASVDGPIELNEPDSGAKFLVDLIKVEVTTRTPDPMSAIIKGSITLEGRLITGVCQHIDVAYINFLTEAGRLTTWNNLDTSDISLKEGSNVFLVPFGLKSRSGSGHFSCLLLEELPRAPGRQNQYRRLGHFFFDDTLNDELNIERFCHSGEVRVFIII